MYSAVYYGSPRSLPVFRTWKMTWTVKPRSPLKSLCRKWSLRNQRYTKKQYTSICHSLVQHTQHTPILYYRSNFYFAFYL